MSPFLVSKGVASNAPTLGVVFVAMSTLPMAFSRLVTLASKILTILTSGGAM